ncbi:MAG: M16 family metallopeptidase [Cyclobacteriaceae bacterium]
MLDRTAAPPFVRSTSFNLPPVHRTKLSNGLNLIQLENVQQDIVKLEVVFEAGKWFESKAEVSNFTLQMLEKGTRSMTSVQLAEFFDRYGAHIEIGSSFDFASISLYALSKYFNKVYPVFLELFTKPTFADDELAQMKDQFLQGLKVKNEKTSYLASKAIRRQLFGSNHPYGHTTGESEVLQVTREDLVSFFDAHVHPTHLFILGRLNRSEVDTITTDFSQLPMAVQGNLLFENFSATPASHHIDKEGSVQTSIRVGKKTIQRTHPDFASLQLLNYYLGGFFGSRLMKNLREEKGLTYGISSSVHPFRYNCALLIGTDVNKENRALAIDEIFGEIRNLKSINENELELARRHFIGSLQGEIASPFSILNKVKNIELYNLSPTYYSNLIEKVDAISKDDLQDLASRYFDEETFHTVSVG